MVKKINWTVSSDYIRMVFFGRLNMAEMDQSISIYIRMLNNILYFICRGNIHVHVHFSHSSNILQITVF